MKRLIYLAVIVLIIILAATIFTKPIILFLARKQLSSVFKDSAVFVGNSQLGATQLTISNIGIKKDKIYDFKVREVRIDYNLKKISLKDVSANISTPQEELSQFTEHLNLKTESKKGFFVKVLEFSNLDFNLKTKDLNLKAHLSMEIGPKKTTINYFKLKMANLDTRGLRLKDATLNIFQNQPGELYIEEATYNKLKLKKIQGKVSLDGHNLIFHPISARALNGEIQGNLTLGLDEETGYTLDLKTQRLSLTTLVDDFNWNEKFQLSGSLGGSLNLEGKGYKPIALAGNFSVSEPGGSLTIKDKRFLENMARNTGQSLDLLIESFKDYHYNIGSLKLTLRERDLWLEIALDGPQGRRNLTITVHDFKLL